MKKSLSLLAVLLLIAVSASGQRFTDKLDRGLVAVPANMNGGSGTGNFVSWRIFGEEYYDVTYNLYCDGRRIASNLNVSNYTHAEGTNASSYQVAAVVNGLEQQRCPAVKRWENGYLDVFVKPVYDRNGVDITESQGYILNDVSLGDVDGDGISELVVKRLNTKDLRQVANKVAFNHYECYNIKGERLWSIDMGPNLMAGPDEQFDLVLYDWDEDGRCELLMRGADNMVIYMADGKVLNVGDMTKDTRWNGIEYTTTGAEYLLYMEGATARPYDWDGQSTNYTPMAYPLPRYEVDETDDLLGSSAEGEIWGGGVPGHRPTKHFFGAPFLDGRHASIFLARGIYTREKMVAFDVDPQTHELTERWRWHDYGGSPYFGCGYHNFIIADVDWDGRDEIVYGSMVVDDSGQGLSTSGLGHGDAQHCSDLDPYRHGQEQFACNESAPAMNYRDATTSKIYFRQRALGDDGRALCGNFSNKVPGCLGRSIATGMVSTVADKVIPDADGVAWDDLNFRIYWDGDLCEEVLNSTGIERDAIIFKPGGGRIFGSTGCQLNNGSKNNPGATGDIFGDWREEVVLRAEGSTRLRIYTTPRPTEHRIYTLWHDHQYRQAMVWQCLGYNQPPHASFFLGELENITVAPPPLTMTGRTEIPNGGTISASETTGGQHVMVCETNDTHITLENGATPAVATFNVPSWVQGTNSTKTDGTADIIRDYYTCTVTGGGLSGSARLVKQGDGRLVLPKADFRHHGPTDIWAGTLVFDGTMQSSDLWLNRFARLESDGGQFKSIRMDYAASLSPGGDGHPSGVQTEDLTLGFGSRLVIDLYSGGNFSCDHIKTSHLTIETKDWKYGPKYLEPVIEFHPHTYSEAAAGSELLDAGRYCIMSGLKETVENLSAIVVEGIDDRQKVTLEQVDDCIYAVIEDLRQPSTIIWNGQENTFWDKATSHNFTLADNPEVTDEMFVTGDKVLFDGQSAVRSIELKGTLIADSVIFDGTKKLTLNGRGNIGGEATLVKRGTGTLVLETENSYTGGTRISGGKVVVNSLSSDTQEHGNLGSPTTSADQFIIENGATLENTSGVACDSPIQILGDEGGVMETTGHFSMYKPITGTHLTKDGKGALILYDNNSLQSLLIKDGNVEMRRGQAARAIELQGGAIIDFANNTAHSIHVPAGKSATWQLSGVYYLAYANKLTGEGKLTIVPTNTVSRVRIIGDWSDFKGTICHTTKNIWLPLDMAGGIPDATLNLGDGCGVTNVVKTFTIGCLTGSGSLNHPVFNFVNSAAVYGSNTWRVGNSTDRFGMDSFTWNGIVHDDAGSNKSNFEKIGTCKMAVTGKWDCTGTVTVSAGTLQVKSGARLGTGALTVNRGGTLMGTTKAAEDLTNSSYTILGTVHVGNTENATSGIINFGNNAVTFRTGSTLKLCVSRCASSRNTGGTSIANISRLTMNGKLSISVSEGHTLSEGDSVIVWKAEKFTGTPKLESDVIDEEAGLYWDTTDLNQGILRVVHRVPTAIEAVESESDDAHQDTAVYDLTGRRIAASLDALTDEQRNRYTIVICRGRKLMLK